MPWVGFEPTISAGERPKTYALDRAATGTGNLFISELIIKLFRDWINQIPVGIRRSPMAVLVQFSERLLISFVGSKIENKFLITSS